MRQINWVMVLVSRCVFELCLAKTFQLLYSLNLFIWVVQKHSSGVAQQNLVVRNSTKLIENTWVGDYFWQSRRSLDWYFLNNVIPVHFFFPLDFLEIIKNRHFWLKPLHKCFWLSSLPKLHNNLAVHFKLCRLSFSNSDQN